MTVFVLNLTAFVLHMNELFLIGNGYALKMTRFVLDVTWYVLNMTIRVLNRTGFVQNKTKFVNNMSVFVFNMTKYVLNMKPILTSFEIGCTGLITQENKLSLKHIHRKKDIKLKHLLKTAMRQCEFKNIKLCKENIKLIAMGWYLVTMIFQCQTNPEIHYSPAMHNVEEKIKKY